MADPTPIMWLGITEDVWKTIIWTAVTATLTASVWLFWKLRAMSTRADTEKLHETIKGLATKLDTDAVCSLMESSEKAITALQGSIDEGTRINKQVLDFQARQLDEQDVTFTAAEVVARGENGGGD